MQILLRFLFVCLAIGQSVAVLNNAQQDLANKPTESSGPAVQYLPSYSADSTQHQGAYQYNGRPTLTQNTITQTPQQYGGSSQQNVAGTGTQSTQVPYGSSQQNAPATITQSTTAQESYQYSGPSQQAAPPTTTQGNQDPYQYSRPSQQTATSTQGNQGQLVSQVSQQTVPATVTQGNPGPYQYGRPSQQTGPATTTQGNPGPYQYGRPSQQTGPATTTQGNQGSYQYGRPSQQTAPATATQYNGYSQQNNAATITPNTTPKEPQDPYQYSRPSQQNAASTVTQDHQGSYQHHGSSQEKLRPTVPQGHQGSYQNNEASQNNGPPTIAQANQGSQEKLRPTISQAPQGSYHYNGPSQGNVPPTAPQGHQGSYQYNGPSEEQAPGSYQYNGLSPGNAPPQQNVSPTRTPSPIEHEHQGPYQYNEPSRPKVSPTLTQNFKPQTTTGSSHQPDPYQYNNSYQHQLYQNTTVSSQQQGIQYNRPSQENGATTTPQPTTGTLQQEPNQYTKPSQLYLPPSVPQTTPAPTTTRPVQYQTPAQYNRPSQHYLPPVLATNTTSPSTTSSQQNQGPSEQYLPTFPGNSNTEHYVTDKTQELTRPTTTPVPITPTSSPSYHGPSYQYLPATTKRPNRTTPLPSQPTQTQNSGNYFSSHHWTPIKSNIQTTTPIPQHQNHGPVALHQGYRYNTPAQKQTTSQAETINGVIYNELGMGMNTSAANQYFPVTQTDPSGRTEIETKEGYSYGKPGTQLFENPDSVTHLKPVPTMPSSYIYYRPQPQFEGTRTPQEPELSSNNQKAQQMKQESNDQRPSSDYSPNHSNPNYSLQYEGNNGDKVYTNQQQQPPPSTLSTRPGNSPTINQHPAQSSAPESVGNFKPSIGVPSDYITSSHPQQHEGQKAENHTPNNPVLAPARPGNAATNLQGTPQYSHSQPLSFIRPNENFIYHHPGAMTNSEAYQTPPDINGQSGNTEKSPPTTVSQNHQASSRPISSLNQHGNTNFVPASEGEPSRNTPSKQLPSSQHVWNQSQGDKDYPSQGSFLLNRNPYNTNASPVPQTEYQGYYSANQVSSLPQQTPQNSQDLSENSNHPSEPHRAQQFPSRAQQQPAPSRSANFPQSNIQVSAQDNRQVSTHGQVPQVAPQGIVSQQYNLQSSPGHMTQFRPAPLYNMPLSSQGNTNTSPAYQTSPQTQGSFTNKPQIYQQSQRYPLINPQFSQQNFQNPSQNHVALNQATESPISKYPSLTQTEGQRLRTEVQTLTSPLPQHLSTSKQFTQYQQTFLAQPTTASQVPAPNTVSNFFGPPGHISGAGPNPTGNGGNLNPNISRKPENKPLTFEDTKTFIQMPSHSFELTPYFTMVPNSPPQGLPQQPRFLATQPPVVIKSYPLPKPLAPVAVAEQKPLVFRPTPAVSSPLPLPKPLLFVESPIVPQEPIRQPHLQYGSPIPEASNTYLPPSGVVQPPYYKK